LTPRQVDKLSLIRSVEVDKTLYEFLFGDKLVEESTGDEVTLENLKQQVPIPLFPVLLRINLGGFNFEETFSFIYVLVEVILKLNQVVRNHKIIR
jgi:hypothetical protein